MNKSESTIFMVIAALALATSVDGQTELFRYSKYDQADGAQGTLRALAFDAQGDTLASAGKDGTILIRDLATKQVVRKLEGHPRQVNALALTRDGRYLASASDDRTARLWDLKDGSSRPLAGHSGKVLAVAFNPGGDTLASAGDDKQVLLWSVNTATRIGSLVEHKKKVTHLLFLRDESLFSVGEDRMIIEWDVKAKRILRSWQEPAPLINSATALGDWLTLGTENTAPQKGGSVIQTPGPGGLMRQNEIKIYSVASGGLEKAFDVGSYQIAAMSISSDSNYLVAAQRAMTKSSLAVWDIRRGEQVAVIEQPTRDHLTAVAFSPNGKWLVSATESGRLDVWKTEGAVSSAPVNQQLHGVKLAFLTKREPLFAFRQLTTLAMLDLDPLGLDKSIAQIASEQIRARLAGALNIRLIERQKVDRVVQEQKFQQSGQTDPVTAARIGKILNVSRIALGTLARLGGSLIVTVQLVDVETAAIEGIRQLECRRCADEELTETVAYLQPALTQAGQSEPARPPADSESTLPSIKITYPADGERANNDEIVVQGVVNDARGLTGININASAEGGARGLTVAKWSETLAGVTVAERPKSYQFRETIRLATGSNVITITARNVAGMSGQVSRVVYRDIEPVPGAPVKAIARRRWAFIVGISDYLDSSIPRLRFAHRDAEDLKKLLLSPAGGGYAAENIVLITNQQATWERIREELREFARKPDRDDQVVFYLAAHAAPDPGQPENIYFIAHNTMLDKLAGTALSIREIELALRENLRAQRVVIFADTCYSGAFGSSVTRAVAGNGDAINYAFNEAIRRSKPGTFILTSSLGNEVSNEGENWGGGHGVFTWHLLQALEGKADVNGDGVVTAGEVFPYVYENVTKDTNRRQHPASLSSEYDPKLPLAITAKRSAQTQKN